jgi:hypothetical protein
VSVALRDEALEVAAEHDALDDVTEDSDGGVEGDGVDHPGSRVGRLEAVFVVETLERTSYLFVDEPLGRSNSTIRLVMVNGMPKWRARHVTSSPGPIRPLVTPATARSPECAIDATCSPMSNDRSNARSGEHGRSVMTLNCTVMS